MPDKLWLSAEKLDPEGLYLLENGHEAFLYVGKAAPPQAVHALLGAPPPPPPPPPQQQQQQQPVDAAH